MNKRVMSKCDNCRLRKESAKAFDIHWHGEDDCPYAICPVPDFPKTNGDQFRAMVDEELADFLAPTGCPYGICPEAGITCNKCWLEWLKAEAK